MCECGCGTCDRTDSEIKESADPYIEEYKHLLKKLGQSISSVHKTEEGKKLSGDYWRDVVKLLKKVKLGVAMMELGIDDEDEIHDTHDSEIDKVKPTPALAASISSLSKQTVCSGSSTIHCSLSSTVDVSDKI